MRFALTLLCAAADLALASPLDLPGELPDLPLGGNAKAGNTFKTLAGAVPTFKISKTSKGLAPGYIFFQPQGGPIAGGYIYTDSGELVYSGHGGSNFGVQTVNGQKVLNYWSGTPSSRGFGYGGPTILDNSYQVIHSVCPKLGLNIPFYPANKQPKCQSDLHESQATNRGTTVVTAYNVTKGNLKSVGGPQDGYVLDSQFHEVDIATSKIVFSWKSLDHVPVSAARVALLAAGRSPTRPFDYFHINSIDPLDDGRYLVSSRQTSALYMVKPNGKIEWTFNGFDGGDFKMPAGAKAAFGFQHHARVDSINAKTAVITLFNNNNGLPTGLKTSRGLKYSLDLVNMKATLQKALHQALHPEHSDAEGSVQTLPNGNTLVSYGDIPIIQEFGPGGDTDLLLDINWASGEKEGAARSYRAFKYVWNATPHYPPSVVGEGGKGYVSWNGATDVTSYKIFAGKQKGSLKAAGSVKKSGFETSFPLPSGTKFMKVAAYKGSTHMKDSLIVGVKG